MTDDEKSYRNMQRMKATLAGFAGLLMLFNVAALVYTRPQRIGPQADTPALVGRSAAEQVFSGGPVETHTVIAGSALQPGENYAARGRLTIEGDVPAGVTITVRGKLAIHGDVGANARLRADVPLVTHTEPVTGIAMPAGKCSAFDIAASVSIQCRTVVDGTKYKDGEAAITVTGKTGPGVRLETYGGVEVKSLTKPADVGTRAVSITAGS